MGLLAVGQASLEKYRGLDVARAEMARLTAEFSLQCSATALIGGDLVILARAGMPQSHEGLSRVRERRLMIPPMRSEEHTSELQSLMPISYASFCLRKK